MRALAIGASVLTLLAQPAFAAPCQLSNEDFAALRTSRSQIQDQSQVDALPEKSQEILCRTRINFKKYHQSGGGIQSVSEMAALYLSPAEAKEYSDWLDALFRKKMDH
jgi:hypothetical protein